MLCSLRSLIVCACLAISGIVCAHDHTRIQQSSHTPLTHQEEKDLELLTTHDQSPGIIALLDTTHTHNGKTSLQNLIQNPIVDIQELTQRQEFIEYLHQHPEILQKLQHLLKIIGSHEATIVKLYDQSDRVKQQALKEFYFPTSSYLPSLQKYNTSPFMLDVWQWAQALILAAPTIEHLVMHYLISEKLQQSWGIGCSHTHHKKHDHHKKQKHCHKKSHHHDDHHHTSPCSHHHDETLDRIKKAVYVTYNILHAGFHIAGLVGLNHQIKAKLALLKELQEDLIKTRQLFDAINELTQVLDQYEPLKILSHKIGDCRGLFKNSETIQSAYQGLNNSTFTGKASLWNRPGVILATYKKIMHSKTELSSLLAQLGMIDAFVSLAHAYHASQAHEHKYTMANFVGNATSPCVELSETWHPLLVESTISTQSISLGVNSMPRALFITGDNMAGKSTTIKMVALCIILGQTCGFVPAKAMRFTPFTTIKTSLSLDDNISKGISRFAAEQISAESILTACAQSKGFAFVAIDELFVGTNAQKGERKLEEFITSLCQCNGWCGLISTHYEQLSSIMRDYPHILAHYKANRDIINNTTYRYRISPA
jgi:DNA mismatch repair ATPase MutS